MSIDNHFEAVALRFRKVGIIPAIALLSTRTVRRFSRTRSIRGAACGGGDVSNGG